MAYKQIAPGDLVFVENEYLNLIYSDAFNYKHSNVDRPFLVLGKHENCPRVMILAPVSSKLYYNYCKLEKRTSLKLEEPASPSVVLVSNNAIQSRSFFNGAVLLDQSIAAPQHILTLYRTAFKDYTISPPREPSEPIVAAGDPSAKKIMKKYADSLNEWNKCTNTSLFMSKVNINWFVTNGKNAVRHLSKRGKMDYDINLSLGVAFAYANPKLLEF